MKECPNSSSALRPSQLEVDNAEGQQPRGQADEVPVPMVCLPEGNMSSALRPPVSEGNRSFALRPAVSRPTKKKFRGEFLNAFSPDYLNHCINAALR